MTFKKRSSQTFTSSGSYKHLLVVIRAVQTRLYLRKWLKYVWKRSEKPVEKCAFFSPFRIGNRKKHPSDYECTKCTYQISGFI